MKRLDEIARVGEAVDFTTIRLPDDEASFGVGLQTEWVWVRRLEAIIGISGLADGADEAAVGIDLDNGVAGRHEEAPVRSGKDGVQVTGILRWEAEPDPVNRIESEAPDTTYNASKTSWNRLWLDQRLGLDGLKLTEEPPLSEVDGTSIEIELTPDD